MTSDNNPTWVLDMLTKLGYKTNPSGGIVKIGEGLSVTEDGTLSTTKHVFSILPLSGTGGRINPDHKVTVDKGDSYHVTILPDDGYKISNVIVDGISRGAISEYTFIDISQDHYIAASFEEAPVYGYAISSSISSPSGCIFYTGESAVLNAEQRKAKTYGWVKPTIVNRGRIVYDLKRDDLTKKTDGSAAQLDGTDGDVCASFQKLWFRFAPMAGGYIQVNISETEHAGYISFHKFNGIIRDWIHLGMFEATGTTVNSVYSTTLTPTVSQSLKTFRSQVQAKNADLAEKVYGIETYLTHTMYQALFIHAYGSLNSQAVVGNGNTKTSAAIPVGNADLLTCSGEYGSTAAENTHVMALFVVNAWGNVWKFMEGSMWNTNTFSLATDQADIYDIEAGWAGRPTSWHTFKPGLANSTNWGYISKFNGDPYACFFPDTTTGTSDTFACDNAGFNTGARCCIAGGDWADGAAAGLFKLVVDAVPGRLNADVGARLQALDAM